MFSIDKREGEFDILRAKWFLSGTFEQDRVLEMNIERPRPVHDSAIGKKAKPLLRSLN